MARELQEHCFENHPRHRSGTMDVVRAAPDEDLDAGKTFRSPSSISSPPIDAGGPARVTYEALKQALLVAVIGFS